MSKKLTKRTIENIVTLVLELHAAKFKKGVIIKIIYGIFRTELKP